MLRFFFLILALMVGTVSAMPLETPNAEATPVVRFGFLKPMKAYGVNNYQPGEADLTTPMKRYLTQALPDVG